MKRSIRFSLLVVLTMLCWWPAVGSSARDVPPSTHGITLRGLETGQTHSSAEGGNATIRYSERVETPIPFSMIAFDVPRGSTIWVRTGKAKTWADWVLVENYPEDEGPDDLQIGDRIGTHPLWVRAADHLELRIEGGSPEDVDVHLIDSMGLSTSLSDELGALLAPSVAAAAPRPGIISRSQWGADESLRSGTPTFASRVDVGVVHHTAGSNDYTKSESPAIVRGIYYYHTKVRGWSDIGYNLLVDKYGQIFEGRYGGLRNGVVGAHTKGFNTGSFGVSLMGNFSTAPAPSAMLEATYRAISWQWEVYGINPDPAAKLWKNNTRIRPLNGHRDLGQTACPGDNVYPVLASYRARLPGNIVPGWQPLVGDWDGDGIDTPLWHRAHTFRLINVNAPKAAVWSFDYGRPGDVPVVGDWDGDGKDSVGVFRAGTWYLKNQNTGGPADVTFTLGGSGDVPVVGDWNGDGIDTPGFIRGRTWHLSNSHRSGTWDHKFNYGRIQDGDLPLVGDWNKIGADRVGIVRDGEWHLRHQLDNGVADRVFTYGRVLRGDRPVTGKWSSPNTGAAIADGPAVVRGSGYYLRHALSSGNADIFFPFPGPDA